jgi:threo-3-hydroxy-L-aspartate ammonia-lyase
MITIEDVRDAAKRIARIANRTPVLTSRSLDDQLGANVFLKAENYQRTGSFKFRGAFNRASRLSDDELARGLVTISSGNHAQALALAARLLGTTALILMPSDAPATKREATLSYGAEIVEFDRYTDSRDEIARTLADEHGRTFVPPYDHPQVMAGQGTAALELFEEIGEIDLMLVPVSGGGLIAGCGTAAKALAPHVHLVGVEPATGDDTKRSLHAGERISIPVPKTIADGLTVPVPGELTFEVNKRNIDEVVLVTDDEVRTAMAFLFDRLKTVVEPSGAVGVAALLATKLDVRNNRVGVILSGGNVGRERFAELVGSR